jgi:hypothetical protein
MNSKEFVLNWRADGSTSANAYLGLNFDGVGSAFDPVVATSAGLQHGVKMRTSTVLNDSAYLQNATTKDTFFSWRHRVYFAAKLNTVGFCRCWMGMTTTTAALWLAADNPASVHIGFRMSSSAGDANWKAVVSSGAAQTVVDTGVAQSSTITQNFRIEWPLAATDIKFYINNVLVATIATNLPAAGTDLRMVCGVTTLFSGARAELSTSILRVLFNAT